MANTASSDSLGNVAEYSVAEISGALKRTVEDAFGHVRVRGEISGFRGRHSSGHCYFALKDDRARLEAVIWKGTFARLKYPPEEGMEVIATGRLTTYPGSSKYQIIIDNIEPAGAGALMALLEERKRKLGAEGLFAEERKRALPFMPRVIGVVTSPTGAVIRDIIHRISERFPVHVLVWPVRVQGDTTGTEVSRAVAGFNALDGAGGMARPDVLIVARGGGSLEDLWGFNDEAVVRAVAASAIPVISAVGHETDWTLVDLAADRRAPTPTGAAEIAVPVKADLEASLARLSARLKATSARGMERRRERLRALARALPTPDQLLALPRRRFDEAAGRSGRALEASTRRKRAEFSGIRLTTAVLERRHAEAKRNANAAGYRLPAVFAALVDNRKIRFQRDAARVSPAAIIQRISIQSGHLRAIEGRADRAMRARLDQASARRGHAARMADSLSHKAILERGFALVHDAKGALIKRAAEVAPGEKLAIRFADDAVEAVAAGEERTPAAPARSKARPVPEPESGGRQGSLF